MNKCTLIDNLIMAWDIPGNTKEKIAKRINARLELESYINTLEATAKLNADRNSQEYGMTYRKE